MTQESAAPPAMPQPRTCRRLFGGRKPRESLPAFLAKGCLATGVLVGACAVFLSFFQLHYDPQKNTSLPYHAWVVATYDQAVSHGDYVAFYTDERMSTFFSVGTSFIKKVIGMPGDRVQVREGKVIVNDEVIAGLPLSGRSLLSQRFANGLCIERGASTGDEHRVMVEVQATNTRRDIRQPMMAERDL